jgi:hypothetical protein
VQSLLLVQCDSTGKNVKQILMDCQSDRRRGKYAVGERARDIRRFGTLPPRMPARVFRRDRPIRRGQGSGTPGSRHGSGMPGRVLVIFSYEMYFTDIIA